MPLYHSCSRKQQLAEEIRALMDQIMRLNARQFGFLAYDKSDEAESIRAQLTSARSKKEALLKEFRAHEAEHRC
jgi:hypothetical protein